MIRIKNLVFSSFIILLLFSIRVSSTDPSVDFKIPRATNDVTAIAYLSDTDGIDDSSLDISLRFPDYSIKNVIFNYDKLTKRLDFLGLEDMPPVPNQKNPDLYDPGLVLLVSDNDWRDALSLVPLSVWTGSENWCERGYGTPDNVCTYPLLIYHEEKPEDATIHIIPKHLMDFTRLTFYLRNWPIHEADPNSATYTDSFTTTEEQRAQFGIPQIIMYFNIQDSETPLMDLGREIAEKGTFNGKDMSTFSFEPNRIGNLFKITIFLPKQELLPSNTVQFNDESGEFILKEIYIFPPDVWLDEPGSLEIIADSVDGCRGYGVTNTLCIQNAEADKTIINPGEEFTITYTILNKGKIKGNRNLDLTQNKLLLGSFYIPENAFTPKNFEIEEKLVNYRDTFEVRITFRNTMTPQQEEDAESTFHFINQYPTSTLRVFNEMTPEFFSELQSDPPIGAGMAPENIETWSITDYFSYWNSYDTVIFVEDNYELALLASAYASIMNYPLIIENSKLDTGTLPDEIKIICVGDVDKTCHTHYETLESLQDEFIIQTNTNKLILLNPLDFSIKRYARFNKDFNGFIQSVYTRDSLSAPVLAAAKHELIVPVTGENHGEIDQALDRILLDKFNVDFEGSACQPQEGEDCAQGYERRGNTYYAYSDSTYTLDELNPGMKYYLEVKVKGNCKERIDIYLNENNLGYFYRIGYNFKIRNFEIEDDFDSETATIQMKVMGDCSYYYAEVRLMPILEDNIFITIVASPDAIQMSDYRVDEEVCGTNTKYFELDNRVYGSRINWGIQDFPVGRIMGISISDSSAHIARSIHFNKLEKSRDALLIMRGSSESSTEENLRQLSSGFWTDCLKQQSENTNEYYTYAGVRENIDDIKSQYLSSFLVLYYDHGTQDGFSGTMSVNDFKDMDARLTPNMIIAVGCATCKYGGFPRLFCTQNLRRGAMVYQGASDVSYWMNLFEPILQDVIFEEKSIGEAIKRAKNIELIKETRTRTQSCYSKHGDEYYFILGDPTWKPAFWEIDRSCLV